MTCSGLQWSYVYEVFCDMNTTSNVGTKDLFTLVSCRRIEHATAFVYAQLSTLQNRHHIPANVSSGELFTVPNLSRCLFWNDRPVFESSEY